MSPRGWIHRVKQAVWMGAGKAGAVIQTVTVLWYKYGKPRASIFVRPLLRRARKGGVGRIMARGNWGERWKSLVGDGDRWR